MQRNDKVTSLTDIIDNPTQEKTCLAVKQIKIIFLPNKVDVVEKRLCTFVSTFYKYICKYNLDFCNKDTRHFVEL